MIRGLQEAPLILPEGTSFDSWLEDRVTRVIEEAERDVRNDCLEYAGLADWD